MLGFARGWRRLLLDRDALLHRYTVALAYRWLACPMTCGGELSRGVVSKRAHGSDGGYDTGCDGVNVIVPHSPEMRSGAR